MVDLSQPITTVHSVGARSAARLKKLGISTVRHLLWHLPARYEDYRQRVLVSELVPGEKMSIQGQVVTIGSRFIWPRRLTITTAIIGDESGAVRAVWFNQPYLEESLGEGMTVSLAGKVVLDKRGLYMASPVHEKIGGVQAPALRHTGRLVPIYPETEGVTSKYLRFLIGPLIEQSTFSDPVPMSIIRRYGLMGLTDAIRTIHYPANEQEVPSAKERLAFDDLLLFQIKALHDRRLMNKLRSPRIALDAAFMKQIVTDLPFALTRDQRVATFEILKDMERPYPMNRLLEGDVGSGKTIVAILAALHAAQKGFQTVIIAPTEVLALQHYATLRAIVSGHSFHVALITGAAARIDRGDATKAAVKKAIAGGVAKIIIGTHAVFEEDVKWHRLALVVIDEQHRFGITQRSTLVKADRHASGQVPHLLSMTATPIPRTLALTIFGDLDISIIKEKPKGRQPIMTKVFGSTDRNAMYDAIRRQVREGRQVFVICPRIEVSAADPAVPSQASPTPNPSEGTAGSAARWGWEGSGRRVAGPAVSRGKPKQSRLVWAEVKAVQDEYEKLAKQIFPDLKVTMLHGRMKPKEKQSIMTAFKDGWHDILVSTSVIEVGVDVPNATVMLIEGADRFGLAQLHQFRGRVGRGEHQSYCFLVPTDDALGKKRLSVLEKTDDGFLLAEADMKIRGPGEFFGIKQSGIPDLTMTALANVDLIKKARLAARTLMKDDPDLKKYPLLRAQLESFRTLSHFE